MNDKTILNELQTDIKRLERQEIKISGSLETLFNNLKQELGDPSMTDAEALDLVDSEVKNITKKIKKAKKQFAEKVSEIEEVVENDES